MFYLEGNSKATGQLRIYDVEAKQLKSILTSSEHKNSKSGSPKELKNSQISLIRGYIILGNSIGTLTVLKENGNSLQEISNIHISSSSILKINGVFVTPEEMKIQVLSKNGSVQIVTFNT